MHSGMVTLPQSKNSTSIAGKLARADGAVRCFVVGHAVVSKRWGKKLLTASPMPIVPSDSAPSCTQFRTFMYFSPSPSYFRFAHREKNEIFRQFVTVQDTATVTTPPV